MVKAMSSVLDNEQPQTSEYLGCPLVVVSLFGGRQALWVKMANPPCPYTVDQAAPLFDNVQSAWTLLRGASYPYGVFERHDTDGYLAFYTI